MPTRQPQFVILFRVGMSVNLCLFLADGGCSKLWSAERDFAIQARRFVGQFCFECHGNDQQEAELNLERLALQPDMAHRFRQWRKVAEMLQRKKMPPADGPKLNNVERKQFVARVRDELRKTAIAHSADPGPVTMRRLTSAEYAYTIRDLTGLDLDLQRDLVGDAVGGEGFTNVGDVQLVQDVTLERYLAAAKKVADHAVVGAGPLQFYQDPGKTGFELSAITRIQNIYRAHGFRTAAGEGGEAFGLDRYARAFFVAWQFQHRAKLGLGDETLGTLAANENVDARFAEYLWYVLTERPRAFPTSDIIAKWRALPAPRAGSRPIESEVRKRCDRIQKALHDWQSRLGENPDAKEEARVLTEKAFDVSRAQLFEMNVNWPKGTKAAHVTFVVESADNEDRPNAAVIWRNPVIQFRIPDRILEDPQPLRKFLAENDRRKLDFGTHARGGKIGSDDFVTIGAVTRTIKLPILAGATSARMFVNADLDIDRGDDRIIRCTIVQKEETDQGKSVSALLANPNSPSFREWKDGVLEFARLLPQISQREPAPSDRDPIPPPFDPTYNNPQRNFFHARIKYQRDDRFLVENILDDATRKRLDHAWHDLLGSFEYHDTFLRVVADKYKIDLGGRGIAELTSDWIERLPAEPRKFVARLHREYHAIDKAFDAAQPGHVEDVLRLADRAWRRPLVEAEQQRLREFYQNLRKDANLDHREAIRTLLTRVLMAPSFLYRAETPSATAKVAPVRLSNWELASRLSYFLWSSPPDDELRRAAASGELADPNQLARQAKRMLRDPKARRMSAEFFGQWFGFYQFGQHRGVDPKRFPEFTDSLKLAMHDEAVSFFEHIIRDGRPVCEILFADYAFLNRELAAHYGIEQQVDSQTALEQVKGLTGQHRGGLFGLGAVLTVTSAPRRTSPVKRGDWILRRVLGTPVPRPPADAGSIPADDVLPDRLTVRQRLAAHRRDATCNHCHARIDPLGFTLEHFDAIGRWRDRYRDGKLIDDGGKLKDGTQISGPGGLRGYLTEHENLFQRNLCTKLVSYALGRRESIADVILIEQMMAELEGDGRFSKLVERIVRSRQFRYQRGSEHE